MGIRQNQASGASLDSISWNVLIIIRTRMPNSHAIWPLSIHVDVVDSGLHYSALQRWRLKTYQASVYRWYTVSAPESLDLCDRGGVSPDVLDNQGPRRINTFISTCPPTLIRSTDALSQNWLQSEATQHNQTRIFLQMILNIRSNGPRAVVDPALEYFQVPKKTQV